MTIFEQYMLLSESWENNPLNYVQTLSPNRALFLQTLTDMTEEELDQMVEPWSKDTCDSVHEYGSDLGLDKATRGKVNKAVGRRLTRDFPIGKVDNHGMNDQGGQRAEGTVTITQTGEGEDPVPEE